MIVKLWVQAFGGSYICYGCCQLRQYSSKNHPNYNLRVYLTDTLPISMGWLRIKCSSASVWCWPLDGDVLLLLSKRTEPPSLWTERLNSSLEKKLYPFAHQNLQCVNMKHWSLSINCDCFISLHLTASPPLCCGGAGVSSTCLWAKAGSHPGRAASLSQGRRATEQDKQQHTYDQFSPTSSQSSASRARFWTVDLIAVSANHYRHVTNAAILQLLDFYFIALSLLLVS